MAELRDILTTPGRFFDSLSPEAMAAAQARWGLRPGAAAAPPRPGGSPEFIPPDMQRLQLIRALESTRMPSPRQTITGALTEPWSMGREASRATEIHNMLNEYPGSSGLLRGFY